MSGWSFERDAIRAFRFVRSAFDAQTGVAQLVYAFDDSPELVETVTLPGAPFTLDAARAQAAQRALRPLNMPAPRYPPDALRAGTAGEVLVEFTVGTDGTVTDARVLRANPARTFDREALNAVRRWRFEPVDAPVTTRRTVAFNPGT